MRFARVLEVGAPLSVLWAFHERPDALEALQPPWERAEVLLPPRSLEVGTRVELKAFLGPFPMRVEAEHVAYEHGHLFVDVMRRGPFRHWRHEHRFEALAPGASRLVDDVAYELPLGALGRLAGGAMVQRRLDRMFTYRHAVTRAWCETIFHLATRAEWEEGRRRGSYRAASLDSEGFIHASTRAQLGPVARALFAGRDDLVVLNVDLGRLAVPVRWEDAAGPVAGPFPHIYGEIPTGAVVEVTSPP